MTTARITPFRAGRAEGETPDANGNLRALAADQEKAAAAGQAVLLADVSEFEPQVADAAYLAWSRAIVIRAAYGAAHDDRAWYGGARRDALHAGGCRFLGIYQYLVAGQDVPSQFAALKALVGSMRPGEKIIADIEEGAGSQAARWGQFRSLCRSELGDDPWDYSGLYFARDHGIQPVSWVAAYQSAEPAPPHVLWQFSSDYQVPGVGRADCSVFRGSIDQLAALAYGGSQPPPASSWTETLMSELPTLQTGSAGEDVKTVQGLLNARGYQLAIDAAFGPATRSAVTAFQHIRGLVTDSVVGPATWRALLNRLAWGHGPVRVREVRGSVRDAGRFRPAPGAPVRGGPAGFVPGAVRAGTGP